MSRSHAADASRAGEAGRVQRASAKTAPARDGGNSTPLPNHAVVQALGTGAPLQAAVRAEMEQRFGASFADVRVHDDERAHRAAAGLEARAFTHGSDIAFASRQYEPHDPEGVHLLAHELAHVVQQRRGGGTPALSPSAPHEIAADKAASEAVSGAQKVAVGGATGVGVAREPDDRKGKKRKREKSDDAGPVRRVRPGSRSRANPDPVTITDPRKATGVLGEVTTPFEQYSDPSWNVLGGGQETSSSRISIARSTQWGDTAGLDNLIENRVTGRLVMNEQKRLGDATFSKATAITRNLDANIGNAVQKLKAGIKAGRVHPEEIANVENVIARLEQTRMALKNGTSLPEEVVFELTATGGSSTKIGKDYVSMLAEKYDPRTVQRILERTYIRGKGIGSKRGGQVGTDSDPDVVPAKERMTESAKSELQRLLAGKTPEEWKRQIRDEKQAREAERKRARRAEREAKAGKRKADRAATEAEAKKVGEEVRQKTLEDLREAARRAGEPEAKTKAQQRAADNELKKRATKAGKEASKKVLDEARGKSQQKRPAAGKTAKANPGAEGQAKPNETAAPKAETAAKVEPVAPKVEPVAPKVEPVAPKIEPGKPTIPLEPTPGGFTPKEVAGGAMAAAGFLAGVSGVKDIIKTYEAGHPWQAAGKAGMLGLSFVPEAAPPLFAFGTIMNYWGPRHEKIEQDSFDVGDVYADVAGYVPLLGRSETFRNVVGGLGAANMAVVESMAYTAKDMGEAVVDGAETLGGLAEDAYDWLTDGPSLMDIVREQALKAQED